MKVYSFRLLPGDDLRKSIWKFSEENGIKAGVVLTCVGSLKEANLKMADTHLESFSGPFEIVSLVGTIASNGFHLHISLSSKEGRVIGGHLKEGCLVHTTAEVVIGEIDSVVFERALDSVTGCKELVIK